MSKKLIVLILGALLLVACLGYWFLGRTGPPQIKHIILISMDTTRADHLSCYGFDQSTTPNIDALAEKGVRFANTICPIPQTLPSHTSMLTGTIPPHHGKRRNGATGFDPSLVTLATLMKSQGWATGAFVASQVLEKSFGLDRGFDIYHDTFDEQGHERAADEVNRYAFQWLDTVGDSSVFLFLHYYDPHDEYEPPEPYATQFKDNPYAGEIAWVDHNIGKVIEQLKQRGMYDSSLIIVTGDHGEMLGEHGEETHTYFIYQGAVHVPMIWRLPGDQGAGEVVADVNGIVDILPTISGLMEIVTPENIEGVDLTNYLRGEATAPGERYVYCESLQPTYYGANGLFGLVSDRWKYIRTTRSELYDLPADPDEQTNLMESQPEVSARLQANLDQIQREAESRATEQETKALSPELVRHLQSLGYVGEASVPIETEVVENKLDPKDLVQFHNMGSRVTHLVAENRNKEALEIIEKAMREHPCYLFASYGARINLVLKNYEEAIRYGEQAASLRPGYYENHETLAFAYTYTEDYAMAAEHYELTLKAMPETPAKNAHRARLHFQLGMTYEKLAQFSDAYRQQMESLQLNAKQPLVVNALANLMLEKENPNRDPARALQFANQACALTGMRQPELMKTLAMAHASNGSLAEALKVTEAALNLTRAAGNQALTQELEQLASNYRQRLQPSG